MTYVVMPAFKPKEVDSGDTHYCYVRVFSDKVAAELYAKKRAKKEEGLPEECVFALLETTATPAPTDVTMVAAT